MHRLLSNASFLCVGSTTQRWTKSDLHEDSHLTDDTEVDPHGSDPDSCRSGHAHDAATFHFSDGQSSVQGVEPANALLGWVAVATCPSRNFLAMR